MNYFYRDSVGNAVQLSTSDIKAILQDSYSRDEMLQHMQIYDEAIQLSWLIMIAVYVFMMQTAMAFMAVGCSRAKNNQAVLTNHVIFIAMAYLTFHWIGYSLVFNAKGGLFG